jgi:phosphohistidine swiveling domain-containing protein
MQRDIVDPAFTVEPNGKGINASPGFASGPAVFNNEQALASPVPGILVTLDTEADDLPGMNASAGVLTSTGGATCHAAVNSLSFKTPCVVGLGKVGEWIGSEIKEGTIVTIDGSTGRVWIGTEVPTVSGVDDPYVADLVKWGYEKTGAIYQSARVERPEQRVMVTEWLSDEGAKADSLDALANMKEDERSKVVLDVRGTLSFRREEDVSLWECFGDEPDKGDDAEVVAVIDLLEAHGFKGAVVSLEGALKEHAARLEAAGYKVGREVETLADLLHSTGPVEVPKSFIENVVGGPAVYAELIDTFKAAGKEVTPMPVSMSTEQVVAETFGS